MDQILGPPEPRTMNSTRAPGVDVGAPSATTLPSPAADLSKAPLPTAGTLRRRQSVPVQAVRFVVFNARIVRMVLKGHH